MNEKYEINELPLGALVPFMNHPFKVIENEELTALAQSIKESGAKTFKVSSNKTSTYAYSMQTYMNERSVYCVITDKYGNQVQTEVVTIHLEK